MCGYIAIFNGKQVEIFAESLYAAKLEAIKLLRVPKSKQGLLSVMLCKVEDREVVNTIS